MNGGTAMDLTCEETNALYGYKANVKFDVCGCSGAPNLVASASVEISGKSYDLASSTVQANGEPMYVSIPGASISIPGYGVSYGLYAEIKLDSELAYEVQILPCIGEIPSGCIPSLGIYVTSGSVATLAKKGLCATNQCPASAPGSGGTDEPCFDRETSTACRLFTRDASASAAFSDCFGEGRNGVAEKVPMASLVAGDSVLSDSTEVSRVIVNQHATEEWRLSSMVSIKHTGGSLSLTPDHVLKVDGQFKPAREVIQGSMLEPGFEVLAVSPSVGGIINPITTANTILAADIDGMPVLASTHPEWVAEYLLSATVYPSPFSLSALLSYLFPERAQEFYSAHLEPLLAKVNVRAVKPFLAYPTVVVLPAVITGDVLIAFAFSTFFLLTSPTGLALFGLVGLKRYLGGKSA